MVHVRQWEQLTWTEPSLSFNVQSKVSSVSLQHYKRTRHMQAAGAAAVTVVLCDGDTVGGATGAAFVFSTSTLTPCKLTFWTWIYQQHYQNPKALLFSRKKWFGCSLSVIFGAQSNTSWLRWSSENCWKVDKMTFQVRREELRVLLNTPNTCGFYAPVCSDFIQRIKVQQHRSDQHSDPDSRRRNDEADPFSDSHLGVLQHR